MSQLPTIEVAGATGVDVTSDPLLMSAANAQLLVNLLFDRMGYLRANARLVNVLPFPTDRAITGIAWYYNAVLTNVPPDTPIIAQKVDLLLVWVDDGLFSSNMFYSIPSANPLTTTYGNLIPIVGANIGNEFFPGRAFAGRIRTATLSDEMIIVQEGGMQPQRFYSSEAYGGPHLWQCGIDAPPAATAAVAAGAGITGTYTYKMTYYDERGRESSPSVVSNTITLTNQKGQVTIAWNTDTSRNGYDHQIIGAYVYRNTTGGNTWYRVGNVAISRDSTPLTAYTLTTGDWILDLADANDDSTDAAISTQEQCPNPGENDPPNPASIICLHKNRIFMNDSTEPSTLQISNLSAPTQFTSIEASPLIATDGARFAVDSDQGDPITGLISFGAALGIFKRREFYLLWGDDANSWQLQPIHLRGCLSADSATRCDNRILFLSDDGVYQAAYQGGEAAGKISKKIEASLLQQSEADRETAVGFFIQNTYFLAVGMTIYAYNFDVDDWATFVFGMGEYNVGIPGIGNVLIIPPLTSLPVVPISPVNPLVPLPSTGSITAPGGGSLPDTGSGGSGSGSGGGGSGGGPSLPTDSTSTGGGPIGPSAP